MHVATKRDNGLAKPRAWRAPSRALNIALIGNFPPRRCGIATFTADLHDALTDADSALRCDIYAMTEEGQRHEYPSTVTREIRQAEAGDYLEVARLINKGGIDLICVQHEYGIFGGAAGEQLLSLLDAVRAPVIATLHTVLENPTADQRRVLARMAMRASKLIVMAEKGRDILRRVYGLLDSKIEIIPHGVPDHAFVDSNAFKAEFDLAGRDVLLTFGLLSPNKGIEKMIRAMPAIRAARPDALYIVLGATHPHLITREGEIYREGLAALATELGVADAVRFINEYVDRDRLFAYLAAADIYVTPYLTQAQITSGTLSYAIGLGKAVVSTPYWHAQELLADERGLLVPFNDSNALGEACLSLLQNEALRHRIRANAYAVGREMTWARTAERYIGLFAQVRRAAKEARPAPRADLPPARLAGVERMTDHCGMLQHSIFAVPDRAHGYCIDDNARALILMHRLKGMAPRAKLDRLTAIYAAFVNHAWNADNRQFRNFMSYERAWLEDAGSADSFGRGFWALGSSVAQAQREDIRIWALALAERALDSASRLAPSRSRAFAVLGLCDMLSADPAHAAAQSALRAHAEHLFAMIMRERTAGRVWFEPFLSYDNARLPEALIRAGEALDDPRMTDAGLEALAWLCRIQTGLGGCFRPIGSESLGRPPEERAVFDQQPLEAAATIDACAAAFAAEGDRHWIDEARRAFAWFMGENDLMAPVALPEEGLCYDGLKPHGPNRNHGAESVLAFQMSVAAMHRLAHLKARAKAPRRTEGVEDRRWAESAL